MNAVSPVPTLALVHADPPTTFAEVAAALAAAGYVAGPPRALSADAQHIDAQTCRRMKCPGCGKRGMAYRPYHKPNAIGYRVVALCVHCSATEEV